MANKYQLITKLYRTMLVSVTEMPQSQKAFLRSACNNYKCPFDEQVLICEQKPDATAVFEEKNGRSGLKYYFDVADRCMKKAQEFDISRMVDGYERIYKELMERGI